MILNVLRNVVDNLLANSSIRSVNIGLNDVEVVKDVSAIDKPKELKKPSKVFITGSADASSVTIKVVGNEVALACGVVSGFNILVYPEVSKSLLEVPFIGILVGDEHPGITNKYVMLGIKYVEDLYLPNDALAHDIRISIESLMIEKALHHLPQNSLLIVDGPIYYLKHQPDINCLWNEELVRLNEYRVDKLRRLYRYNNILPVNVVKRVRDSYYITSTISKNITDLEYVERLVNELGSRSRPFRTSLYECSLSIGPKRYFTYVVIPRSRIYSSYSIFRVELLKEVYDDLPYELIDSILSYIAYEAWGYGLSLPYKLYVADTYSKRLVHSMSDMLMKLLISKKVLIPYEVLENV